MALSSSTKYVSELTFSPLLLVKKYKIESEFLVLINMLILSPFCTDFWISIFSIVGISASSNFDHSPFLMEYNPSSKPVLLIVLVF